MDGKLVTLIAPCYNAERFLERFLDSVLAQTYKKIQFILVNNACTDRSMEIAARYKDALEEKLFEFVCPELFPNAGPGGGVNKALKYANGDYITWASADDVLYPDNITEKVKFLDEHPECGLVACNAEAIDFESGKKVSDLKFKGGEPRNIFDEILFGSIPCFPGTFMLRANLFWKNVRKDREIYYRKEAGESYQMLLPAAWHNLCGFIDKCLYSYYVRKDSISHSLNYNEKIGWTYIGEDIVKHTVFFPGEEDKKNLFLRLEKKYTTARFNSAWRNRDYKSVWKFYREMKSCGEGTHKSFIKALIALSLSPFTARKLTYKEGSIK